MQRSTSKARARKKPFHVKTLFLSDIHLGNKHCRAEYLLSFLEKISFDRLYLVGDIVDLWAMKNRVFWPNHHAEVLDHFHKLAQSKTKIIYIPGNHDMPLRSYTGGRLFNIEVHSNYIHTTEQGKQLLVLHGDEFDHAVLYRNLNRLIGDHAYDLMTFLNRSVHRLRSLFGLPYWSLANYLKENIAQARKAIDDFERAAITEAKSRGLDGVVCGHIHLPQLREEQGILYCNDGDWTESCSALVEHCDGEMELLTWNKIRQLISAEITSISSAA